MKEIDFLQQKVTKDPDPDPLVRGTSTDPRIRIRVPNVTDPEHCFLKSLVA